MYIAPTVTSSKYLIDGIQSDQDGLRLIKATLFAVANENLLYLAVEVNACGTPVRVHQGDIQRPEGDRHAVADAPAAP